MGPSEVVAGVQATKSEIFFVVVQKLKFETLLMCLHKSLFYIIFKNFQLFSIIFINPNKGLWEDLKC